MSRTGCYVRSSSAPFSLVAWLLSDRSRSEEVDVHVRGGGLRVVKMRSVAGGRIDGMKWGKEDTVLGAELTMFA